MALLLLMMLLLLLQLHSTRHAAHFPQIFTASTTGGNDKYKHSEWSFINSTHFITITGPSPPRNFTLPPMKCFIVTFTPSSAPAGKGFQLNYTYLAPNDPVNPIAPNVDPNANNASDSAGKVEFAARVYCRCVSALLCPSPAPAQGTLVLLTLMVTSLFCCIGGLHAYLKWKESRSGGGHRELA